MFINSTTMLQSILLVPLATGSVFILAGLVLYKFPPKKINALYGYRTNASIKSQERWDFAQVFAGKQMMKLGALLALLSFVGLAIEPNGGSNSMLGLLMIIGASGSLLTSVQRAIKDRFGDL
jgi:hypothetical protein